MVIGECAVHFIAFVDWMTSHLFFSNFFSFLCVHFLIPTQISVFSVSLILKSESIKHDVAMEMLMEYPMTLWIEIDLGCNQEIGRGTESRNVETETAFQGAQRRWRWKTNVLEERTVWETDWRNREMWYWKGDWPHGDSSVDSEQLIQKRAEYIYILTEMLPIRLYYLYRMSIFNWICNLYFQLNLVVDFEIGRLILDLLFREEINVKEWLDSVPKRCLHVLHLVAVTWSVFRCRSIGPKLNRNEMWTAFVLDIVYNSKFECLLVLDLSMLGKQPEI